MKIKKRYISAFVLFLIGGILFVVYFFDYREKESKLFEEFRPVTINDKLSGIVQKIQTPDKAHKNCKGEVNLIFKDYQKLRLCTRSNETTETAIGEVIDIGDSIVKQSGSDTVYLYKPYSRRGGGDYYFLLDGK